jgi:hypothetical protein
MRIGVEALGRSRRIVPSGVTALVEVTTGARYHQTTREKRLRLERQEAFLQAWRGGLAFVAETTEQVLVRFAEVVLTHAAAPEPIDSARPGGWPSEASDRHGGSDHGARRERADRSRRL